MNACLLSAEQSLIGGLLLQNSAWDEVIDLVSVNDFTDLRHRTIFQAISALEKDNVPFDHVTVCDWLLKKNLLKQAGDHGYILEIQQYTPSAANVKAYAHNVRDQALERQLKARIRDAADIAHNSNDDIEEKINDVQALFMDVQTDKQKGPQHVSTILSAVINDLDRRFNNENELMGLSTGLAALDEQLGGLRPSDLILIAGRPSMGKTTLAMNIAEHVAYQLQEPVLVFSMEMSSEQLIERSCASTTTIPFKQIQKGQLNKTEWEKLSSGANTIKNAPLFIEDRAALSVPQIRSIARKIKRQHGLSLIIVDYLQLGCGPGNTREQEISGISRGYKAIAKELNVPFIALSQLNRKLEERGNKRPINADLRDSGSLEQDADIILFIHREEVYNPETNQIGVVEIKVSKFRNGEIGTVFLQENLSCCRFEDRSSPPPPIIRPMRRDDAFDYN